MTTARLALLATLAALGAARPAAAQTFTWDGGGGSGSWSSAANWSADTLPPAGGSTTTAIVLAGTLQTNTVQDRGNPFVLNSLSKDLTATDVFRVSGAPLQFAGASPTIAYNLDGSAASNSPGGLELLSTVDFASATTINIQSASSTATYDIAFNRIVGNGAITQTGAAPFSEVVFLGANTTYTGNLTTSDGFTYLGAVNALSRQSVVSIASSIGSVRTSTVAGSGATAGAFSQQLGQVTGSGGLQIGDPTFTATVLAGFNNIDSTISGQIVASNAGSAFVKVGTGTQTLSGANTNYNGRLIVADGTMTIQTAGRLSSTNTAVGGVQVQGGARLILNNAVTNQTDRLQDSGVVTLSRGQLILSSAVSGTNTSEITGGLRLLAGESTIEVGQGTVGGEIAAGRAAQFRFDGGLSQVDPTATLFLRSTNLNQTGSITNGSAIGGLTIGTTVETSPTAQLVGGGGAPGTTNISILPFVTGAASSAATSASGFVTYVGTDSTGASRTRLLDAAEYAAAFGTATDNVSLAGTATVNTATVANSLRTAAGVTLNAGLTITSGAVLATTTSSVTGTGPLQFGPGGGGTAYLSVVGGSTLTLSAPTTAARLAKSGLGTLTVQSPVTLGASPTVAVNAGTLAVLNNGGSTTGGFTAASGGITYQVSKGAILDVSGAAAGLTLAAAGATLQGNGTVAGTLTVGSGGTVIPSGLGGAATAVTSPGVLAANGNTRFLGGGTYRWHLSSYLGGEYTQSSIAGTGTLDLTDPTLTAANPFVVRPVSLTLQNASGAVYDFDNTQAYSWVLGTFAGGINGFSADKFTVNTADFANPLGGNVFTVAQSGNNLVLNFTPVPEPALMLGVAVAGLAAARRLRRTAFVS